LNIYFDSSWKDLDIALTSHHLTRLRRVEIKHLKSLFFARYNSPEDTQVYHKRELENFEMAFPVLQHRGILTVSLSET